MMPIFNNCKEVTTFFFIALKVYFTIFKKAFTKLRTETYVIVKSMPFYWFIMFSNFACWTQVLLFFNYRINKSNWQMNTL